MYLRKPAKERFLNMGKKRRWFNRPSLRSKIEEVKKAVLSQGSSKTVFMNIEDNEVIDVDESNASFDIIDNDSDNADDQSINDDDEDEFDCRGVAEDPIGCFSDLNPDGFSEINHGTKLDISEQKESSLLSKTDLFSGKMIENSNGSEVSEVSQDEKFSSHNKREYSSKDNNGHTGSDDDDDDDSSTDNECDAYKDLQCRSVEVKSDSENESSVELTKPRFRKTNKNSFLEVISISDSPLQNSEVFCIAESSSHSKNVIEDISTSTDNPVKTSKMSSVEKSCSRSNSEEYFDNLNDSKGGDDLNIDDDSYEIQQEPDRITPLLVYSHEVDGDNEKNLSTESISPKSRNDDSNNNFEDIIISSPVNHNKMCSVAESWSHADKEECYDNDEHTDADNDQEYCDDDDDVDEEEEEDIMYSDTEQEPDRLTTLSVNSHEVNSDDESNLSTELTSPEFRNDHSNNVIEDIDISNSPVKTMKVSPNKELGSHSNSEEYCDNRDDNNEHDGVDNNYKCNDDDADEDVRKKDTEQDPCHLTSFLVESNEIDTDSESDSSTDLIHPKSRSDYSNTCDIVEDVSVSCSPVKAGEESTFEESYSRNNSERCSDEKDNNDGHDGIDDDYEYSDDVIEDIEEESDHLTPFLVNSHEVNDDGQSKLSTELTSLKSSMNNDGGNGIEDDSCPDSPLKSSLSARLFKKYNPEKSESDVDDFELFLQKIRTPKRSKLPDEGKEREASVNDFIVDDDDDEEDQQDDVFFDPGFTPELEEISDDDKENEDIEIATPATSSTLFRTPTSRVLSSNHSARPKGILDNILDPYSTEKYFKKSKDKLVKELFELYNRTVFDNQIPSDFQITWNPRMRSTAGFCYYSKKNGLRMARIELADKVIDSADRLRDTLIHEMCHAAAWLISGVKAGHGAVWKKWTIRANRVHQDLPPISRCHSYTINAKYTYRCTNNNCANTFGRHSKSVNLEKSRCAYCHSRLELAPQLKKDGTPQTRTPSKFALFVKQNYARIKSDHDRFSHQDVMKALSSEFAKVSAS